MSIVRDYVQGALRKRELLCSFVGCYDGKSRKKKVIFQSDITKFDENTIYMNLQYSNRILSQDS